MSPDMQPLAGAPERTVLVDAHVHMHPRFDDVRFFGAAARNFERAAEGLRLSPPVCGILVLTEVAGVCRFGDLRRRIGTRWEGAFSVRATQEEASIRLDPVTAGTSLVVIAGRQIQTAEGLEVLAFPLDDVVPDGMPADEVLDAVALRSAAAVIPWGFGKWWGDRGAKVSQLAARSGSKVLLADTGHRPSWIPVPEPIRAAAGTGHPILTGSDPLPLPGEESRAGSSGFTLAVSDVEHRPAASVLEALSSARPSLRAYHRRPDPLTFAFRQIAMQLRKRVGR